MSQSKTDFKDLAKRLEERKQRRAKIKAKVPNKRWARGLDGKEGWIVVHQ